MSTDSTHEGTDGLTLVADARPTAATADRLWSPQQREASLASIIHAGRPVAATAAAKVRYRRFAIGSVAAGVVAIALVGGSVLLPSNNLAGPQSAAAVINELATTAGEQSPALESGQFWHTVEESRQLDSAGAEVSFDREVWTASDGTIWMTGKGPDGVARAEVHPATTSPSINGPTPAFLATLPTDRRALRTYLDENVTGSDSHDEAVFVAVGDMLRQGFAPPALRAAALGVLADLDGVEVRQGVRDPAGRSTTTLTWVRGSGGDRVEQVLFADPTSSQIVGEATRALGGSAAAETGDHAPTSYSSVTLESGVVDAVPPAVLRTAIDPETETAKKVHLDN